jgi:hypothetical protein
MWYIGLLWYILSVPNGNCYGSGDDSVDAESDDVGDDDGGVVVDVDSGGDDDEWDDTNYGRIGDALVVVMVFKRGR